MPSDAMNSSACDKDTKEHVAGAKCTFSCNTKSLAPASTCMLSEIKTDDAQANVCKGYLKIVCAISSKVSIVPPTNTASFRSGHGNTSPTSG